MARYYRRTEPSTQENLRAGLVAGGLAAAVAAVSFYFVRIILAREPLESLQSPQTDDSPPRLPTEDGS